jgi:RNA polymerase sigma-70 factor (ECF subfamily)
MDSYEHHAALLNARLVAAESLEEVVCRSYEEERSSVYRYLVCLGVEPASAQDLCQEVFLRLFVALKRGEEIRVVKAWLLAVASHLALNHHRAHGYRPQLSGEELERWLASAQDAAGSPELALLQREKLRALHEGIRSLSPQQQVCLHLRAEGFRYREIAEVLGVAVPTVSEFLRRAVTRLRSLLNE